MLTTEFELYLGNLLMKHYPDYLYHLGQNQISYIKNKVEIANSIYDQALQDGHNRFEAEELAKQCLKEDLGISKFDYIEGLLNEHSNPKANNILELEKYNYISWMVTFIVNNEATFSFYNFSNTDNWAYSDEMDDKFKNLISDFLKKQQNKSTAVNITLISIY